MRDDGETIRTANSEAGSLERGHLALRWLYPLNLPDPTLLTVGVRTIGRGAECSIELALGTVSRCHAELSREGPIHALRNRSTTNHTYLDGSRVRHTPVKAGNILRIGECIGMFVEGDAITPGPILQEVAPGLLAGPAMRKVLQDLPRVAQTELPILIVGATGTGKERVARAIHEWSGRKGPFEAINCAALPVELAESELFGHQKGAFTGAHSSTIGRLRAAHGGTLFLDELPDLPLAIQAKLLRVIEDNQVAALGSTRSTSIDLRVVAATHSPLESLVDSEQFRADLCQRLAAVTVVLPRLSERREEIPELFLYFLARHANGPAPVLEAKVIEALCLYSWPGNVRELELLARQLLAFADQRRVTRADLPLRFQAAIPGHEADGNPETLADSRGEIDRTRLVETLKHNGGNLTKAARDLGFSRQRAYRLIKGSLEQLRLASRSQAENVDGDEP